MNTYVKQLDRKFLSSYYGEMVNQIEEVFELFLKEIPAEINEVCDLLNRDVSYEGKEKLQKIIPSFLSIGLPQLTVKLQIAEVYLNFSNLSTAKLLMRSFINELDDYLPAIKAEYRRLKAFQKQRKNISSPVLTV